MLEPRWRHHTQHAEPPYFVHEQSGDDVSGQDSQRSQEVDKVDPVGAVVVVERHLAARLVVVEGAVDDSRVCELDVIDIWKDSHSDCGHMVHISNYWAATVAARLQVWPEMAEKIADLPPL